MILYMLHSLCGTSSFEISTPLYSCGYKHNTGELNLSGLYFESGPQPSLWDNSSEVEVFSMLNRLLTHPMVRVTLRDCLFEDSSYLSKFCSPSLENLTLHNVGLYTNRFDTDLWSGVLDQLSRTPNLKYFEFSKCRYEFDGSVDHVGHDEFQLPSGMYPVNSKQIWNAEFHLVTCEDGQKKVILSDPASICVQLKELADQVAQMEVDKVAEIERDGWVRTNIVGFSKDIESDEDDSSDEEEDGSVQDSDQDETEDGAFEE